MSDAPLSTSSEAPNIEKDVSASTVPQAIVHSRVSSNWWTTRVWWLALLCGLVSAGLFWYSWRQEGELITIEFREGHGLKPEDRVFHAGIEIGEVERIELRPTFDRVLVHVRLTPQSSPLAVEGTRFWIVRPRLTTDAIDGLDTILGAKYLALRPGVPNGPKQKHFLGLESPPIQSPPEGSLEIFLDAQSRGGLENGAPILYRGFKVGYVIQIGLASDARTVRARCAIHPEYRDLVRQNTQFWNRSGWRLDVGFSGIQLDSDTLTQMISGGVEMATPNDPKAGVSTGHRFVLLDKADPEAEQWQPSLAHGPVWNNLEADLPQPIRIAMRWQEKKFGFRRNQQRSGWCLPLSDGSLVCLSEQVKAPESAIADSITVELAGLSLTKSQIHEIGSAGTEGQQVIRFTIDSLLAGNINRWSAQSLAQKLPATTEDCLIVYPDPTLVIAVDAARLTVADNRWKMDETILVDQDANGLPVMSAHTGNVIGMLVLHGKDKYVLPIASAKP